MWGKRTLCLKGLAEPGALQRVELKKKLPSPELQTTLGSARDVGSTRDVGTTRAMESREYTAVVPTGQPRQTAGQREFRETGQSFESDKGCEGSHLSAPCRRLSSSRYSQDMDGRRARDLEVLSVP